MNSPYLASSADLMGLADRWVAHGWIRPLDRAVLSFLVDQVPQAKPLALLAALFASHQAGQGHVCLDLDHCLENPDLLLRLPPTDIAPPINRALTPLTHAERPSALLRDIEISDWVAALSTCPFVADCSTAQPEADDRQDNPPLMLSTNLGRPRLYLRRFWSVEEWVAHGIARRLLERSAAASTAPDPGMVRSALDALFPSRELDWQKIACAVAIRQRFSVITGGPGTGKTTTVVRLLALIQSLAQTRGEPPRRIALCAPTGKAAARLNQSIQGRIGEIAQLSDSTDPDDAFPSGHWQAVAAQLPDEVATLHRLIGMRPLADRPRHHQGNPLPADIVVVDEASMVGIELMAQLLAALRPDTMLILLGDKDQLASVEPGAVLGELCQHAEQGRYDNDTAAWIEQGTGQQIFAACRSHDSDAGGLDQAIVMLRHSHRFGADSDIGRLAAAVNAGDADKAMVNLRAGSDSVRLLLAPENDLSTLERLVVEGCRPWLEPIRNTAADFAPAQDNPEQKQRVQDLFEAHARFQMLTALRRGPSGVEGLNRKAVDWLVKAGLLDENALTKSVAAGWFAGRPVLITRNDPQLGLANGDIGLTLPCRDADGKDILRVAFIGSDGEIRWINPARLSNVETAFALTVHKSQGSEFDHAVLVLPERPNPVLTRELLYTAITRARARFTLWATEEALHARTLEESVVRKIQRSGALSIRIRQAESG